MPHFQQLVHGQTVEVCLRQHVTADGRLQHAQRQLAAKAERFQRFGVLRTLRCHDGKVKAAGTVGAQAALQQLGQQSVKRHARLPRRAAEPDAVVLAVLDRDGRQHGRQLAVGLFQQQDIFQPCDILQPADGIGAGGSGRLAAQRHQRG